MDVLYSRLDAVAENSYFENPHPVYLTVPGTVPAVQLCKFNPRRIALVLGVSIGPVWVSPDSQLAQGSGGVQNGIQLQPSAGSFVLLQSDVGPLCQLDWYAQIPLPVAASSVMTVIEVVLRDRPRIEVTNEAVQSVIRSGSGSNGIPRNSGTKPTSLWDMVFSACRSKGNRPK